MNEITAAQIRELAEADYSKHLPVLSRDGNGDFRVEPESTAAACRRTVVTDAARIEAWSDGQSMTDADCEQFAAELNAELIERGDA